MVVFGLLNQHRFLVVLVWVPLAYTWCLLLFSWGRPSLVHLLLFGWGRPGAVQNSL